MFDIFCPNCGQQIDDKAAICPKCGVPTNIKSHEKSEDNTMAIVGFVLAFIMPFLGLIFSGMGLNRAKDYENGGYRGFATAGIAISGVSIFVCILLIALLS